MSSSLAAYIAIVLAFAAAITAHVALVFGIGKRLTWWRALTALAVVPLAPYFGFRARLRARSVVWLCCVLLYGVMLIVAIA